MKINSLKAPRVVLFTISSRITNVWEKYRKSVTFEWKLLVIESVVLEAVWGDRSRKVSSFRMSISFLSDSFSLIALCTCLARATCTPAQLHAHHRKALVEFYKRTEFGAYSSTFSETRGSLLNCSLHVPGTCNMYPGTIICTPS